MIIERASDQRKAVIAILATEKLPVNDLPEVLDGFFIATIEGEVIATAGLEIYGEYGLLRSLAVLAAHRNKGIAGELITRIEVLAALKGLKEVYLLTETAAPYFINKGFDIVARTEVPTEIKNSSEFANVCPASAIVMKKFIQI